MTSYFQFLRLYFLSFEYCEDFQYGCHIAAYTVEMLRIISVNLIIILYSIKKSRVIFYFIHIF